MSARRWRTTAGRLALVVGGLLLALIAIEAILQVGALAVRLTGRELPGTWATGRPRLLCLGDSNTYGIYVAPGESYPRQLERLLAAANPRVPPYEILNLGFPGNNSSKITAALPPILRDLRPELVTLMIGGNDWWTEPEATMTAVRPTLADRLYRHSRAYRLLYMIVRSVQSPELAVVRNDRDDGRGGTGTMTYGDTTLEWQWERKSGGTPNWAPLLRQNLRAIIAQTRALGVALVLLTYPSEQKTYLLANAIVRQEAAASGTPLIDLGLAFRVPCPQTPCPALFFPDNHPTAGGYRFAAERIVDWLVAHPGGA